MALLDKPIHKEAGTAGSFARKHGKNVAGAGARLAVPTAAVYGIGRASRSESEQEAIEKAPSTGLNVTMAALFDTLRGVKKIKGAIPRIVPEGAKKKIEAVGRTVGKAVPSFLSEPGEGKTGVAAHLVPGGDKSGWGLRAYHGGKDIQTGAVEDSADPLFKLQVSKDTALRGGAGALTAGGIAAALTTKAGRRMLKNRLSPAMYETLTKPRRLGSSAAYKALGDKLPGKKGAVFRFLGGSDPSSGKLKAALVAAAGTAAPAFIADKAMLSRTEKAPHLREAATEHYMKAKNKLAAFKDAKLKRDIVARSTDYNYSPAIAGIIGGITGSVLGGTLAKRNKLLWSTIGGVGGTALPYLIQAVQQQAAPKHDPVDEDIQQYKALRRNVQRAEQNLRKKGYDWRSAAKAMGGHLKDYRYEIGSGLAAGGSAYALLRALRDKESRLPWAAASLGLGGLSAALAYAKHVRQAPAIDLSNVSAEGVSMGVHPSTRKTMRNLQLLPLKDEHREALTEDLVNKTWWDMERLRRLGDPAKIRGGVKEMLHKRFPRDIADNPAITQALSDPKWSPANAPALYADLSSEIARYEQEAKAGTERAAPSPEDIRQFRRQRTSQ